MNSHPLQIADILNADITEFLNSYHGDTSKPFLVGDVILCESVLVGRF